MAVKSTTMKVTTGLFFSLFLLSLFACEKPEEELTKARPYQIVGEHETQLDNDERKAKMWFITSDADDNDAFAQTAIKAAFDFHKKNKKIDLIQVFLVPDNVMVPSSITYAFAYYATDGKGLKFVSGADQNTMTDFKWLVRAAEEPLTGLELQMAKLWHMHQADFPSEDPLSSLSYNREKLVQFIADELEMDPSEVYLPQIGLSDYKELDFLGQ